MEIGHGASILHHQITPGAGNARRTDAGDSGMDGAVADAGGVFAISPGLTPKLLDAAINGPIALIPGISTASELMLGMEYGLQEFKFYPAEAAGGIKMIKSIGGPFPQASFCATGGISPANYKEYLSLKNVACVGGSWLAPTDALEKGDYKKITDIAKAAIT